MAAQRVRRRFHLAGLANQQLAGPRSVATISVPSGTGNWSVAAAAVNARGPGISAPEPTYSAM
ncbi:MAG: hypothetical protein ACOY94_25515 [Bacillota bacterium]